MKKKTVSLTINFSWWNKMIQPVPPAVLTASKFQGWQTVETVDVVFWYLQPLAEASG